MDSYSFRQIGVFHSDFHEKFGTPRQPGIVTEAKGFVQFENWIQPEIALEGLSSFSHVWIQFVFHLNSNHVYRAKVKPPRAEGKSFGALATRSPHRPNPIGLSLLKLEKVEGDKLFVSGPDIVNGTPVLDVKPYLPAVESVQNASSGWLADLSEGKLEVDFQCDVEEQHELLIRQVLSNDVRPQAYKKPGAKEEFTLMVGDIEVSFRVSQSGFEVFLIETK